MAKKAALDGGAAAAASRDNRALTPAVEPFPCWHPDPYHDGTACSPKPVNAVNPVGCVAMGRGQKIGPHADYAHSDRAFLPARFTWALFSLPLRFGIPAAQLTVGVGPPRWLVAFVGQADLGENGGEGIIIVR